MPRWDRVWCLYTLQRCYLCFLMLEAWRARQCVLEQYGSHLFEILIYLALSWIRAVPHYLLFNNISIWSWFIRSYHVTIFLSALKINLSLSIFSPPPFYYIIHFVSQVPSVTLRVPCLRSYYLFVYFLLIKILFEIWSYYLTQPGLIFSIQPRRA